VEIRLRGAWGWGELELEMGRLAANFFFFNGGLGCSELLSADLLDFGGFPILIIFKILI